MRLFTAIDLDADVLLRLERLLSALRPEALIKWSPLDNLHITVKFIGNWPESRLDELNQTLAQLPRRAPFEVELKGLGWFPNERQPRILWAGVEGGDPLRTLAYETEELLEPLGIQKEDRAFSPHLTLARIKSPVPLNSIRQKVEQARPTSFGKFRVAEFALYRSDPGSNASIYRKLRGYRFESAAAAS